MGRGGMSGLSPEAQAKICAELIKDAPPGELEQVVTSVKKLAGDAVVAPTEAAIRHDYNVDQILAVPSEDGSHKVIIAACAELDSQTYIDAATRQAVIFDHMSGKI